MKDIQVFSLLFIFSFLSCKHHEHKQEEVTYKVTNPIILDTTINTEYVCQIQSIQRIELRALEKGYLQKILVDEGQFVKKGQLLFQIQPIIYQTEVQKTAAELSYVEIEYKNTKLLADSNVVSKNELALAKAKLNKAKAELAMANAHLQFTSVKAPFDGIVGRFNEIRLGSLLDEGELLTTLSDNCKMWVYFNVPEAEYLDIASKTKKEGKQKVQLKMANHEIFEQEGVIETIEADFNNETGNIAMRATFSNPDKLLRNGETGSILLPTHLKKVLIIPQEATFDVLDKKFVFLVNKEGLVTAKEIKLGIEMPHLYEVKEGLNPNDKILIEGLAKVKNDDVINTQLVSYEEIFKGLINLHAE
ncbi:MAG: efflux RND transporter periplasmic adaptor subunit [Saprospiraceae bacterium]|nr:efflux RND transporter periplasmic adaptor subunit [Saprospiraceae bacterium]